MRFRASVRVGVYAPAHSVARVPNKPATPTRSIRIPEALWRAALRAAHDNDETVTAVVIRALERYVREHGR